jgi:hypothetical protein
MEMNDADRMDHGFGSPLFDIGPNHGQAMAETRFRNTYGKISEGL